MLVFITNAGAAGRFSVKGVVSHRCCNVDWSFRRCQENLAPLDCLGGQAVKCSNFAALFLRRTCDLSSFCITVYLRFYQCLVRFAFVEGTLPWSFSSCYPSISSGSYESATSQQGAMGEIQRTSDRNDGYERRKVCFEFYTLSTFIET